MITSSTPTPLDTADIPRMEHSRLRRRMLYGLWGPDLAERAKRAMGLIRADAIGEVDLSGNALSSTSSAGAALYDRTPMVTGATPEAAQAMTGILRRAGYWPMMQRGQRDLLALRELPIRIDVTTPEGDALPEVRYRPAWPDLMHAVPDAERPERPAQVREAMLRTDPETGQAVWTWDHWSLVGEPVHQILDERGADVSVKFGLPAGGLRGESYPWWLGEQPILPYVWHHAARGGQLWDSWFGMEIVEGTLNIGVLWTFFAHCVRNASWPQRWILNAKPAGGETVGERQTVTADPAVVLQLVPATDEQGVQPSAGQWASGADPQALAEAIGVYERRVAAFAGLDPSDVQRVSGDPRSGYAISISREGKREAQRRYAPVMEITDTEILRTTAAMVNSALDLDTLPLEGWGVEYQALPPSADELAATRDHALALLQAGLIDQPEARRLLGLPPAAGAPNAA